MHAPFPAEPDAKRARLMAAVDDIAETVRRHADDAEAKGTLSQATVDALVDTGLLGLKLPAALGGAEADPMIQLEVIEAVSAIDPSTGWCLMIGGTGIGLPGAFLTQVAADEMFRGERLPTGAIVSMPTGEAKAVEGGYRVTGRWSFVSGAPHAQWITIGAKISGAGSGPGEVRLMTLPKTSLQLHDNWHVAGLKGTGSCDVSAQDVFVPETFTWDRMRTPPRRGGALYRIGHPGFVANEHAAFALGVGRGALDAIMALAKSKRRSFAAEPSALEQRPVFQRAIGLADMRLRSARAGLLEVYAKAWAIASTGEIPPPAIQAAIRAATAYATEVGVEVTTEAFRFSGGEGAYANHPLQRYLRDINVGAQHLMVSTVAYENHGTFLLGLPGADPLR